MPVQNDATASYLGYLFQGQYALLALWDAEDDDAAVSVETADDVVLEGNDPRLAQLKHALGVPAALTISNVGFWKTIRIWCAHLRADATAHAGNIAADRSKYLFVTVAALAAGDSLAAIVHGAARTDASLSTLTAALVTEASRVRQERAVSGAQAAGLPHADRVAGCEAFLGLSDQERRRLVGRLEILPENFRITDVRREVERRLQRAAMVRATIRESVAERLQERWDRQVALALMGRRDRAIRRGELSAMVEELIREHGDLALPNDFGARLPDADEFAAAKGGLLERQIELVNGGVARVQRAVRDRWRARNQRQRWMDDDASLVVELKVYDDLLKTEWGDRHGPMCDDCRAYDETERARRGLEVLEWAHAVAPITVRPPRPSWSESFYVRGMLQQFADDLEVGWHPAYRERLGGVASTLTASGVDASTEPLQPGPGAQVVEDDDGPYKPDIVDVRMNVDSVAASALRDQVPSDLVPDAPSVTVCSRPVRRARRSTPKATD